MKQVEKMPAVGEAVLAEEQQLATNLPRSFAAVVKSAKFIELESEQNRDAEKVKQENIAKKVQEERRKAEEKADRDAAKEAEEARKLVEAEGKRAANIAKLEAATKAASDYKEQVKILHDKAQQERQESRSYEQELEAIAGLKESGELAGQKRPPTFPAPHPPTEKKSSSQKS